MASLGSGPVLLSVGFIGFFSITLFVRRWLASRRSGGPFFAPFHINRGIFYIHVPLCFSQGTRESKAISMTETHLSKVNSFLTCLRSDLSTNSEKRA